MRAGALADALDHPAATPADFVPWPDLVWQVEVLPPRPASATGERVGAVTASDDGFVAVGYRETEDVRDGVVWSSTDGETWAAVDDALFKGVELVDVAPAPSGFVAVGVESADGDHPSTVVYGSGNGRSWQRLPPLPATGDTYPETIAGGLQGVVVVGSDAAGATAVWRSDDGQSFQRVTLSAPAADGVLDPHAVDDGFVAVGIKDGAPVLLRSADGAAWTSSVIESATNVDASNVVAGRWGIVVHGTATSDCGDPDSCPVDDIALVVGRWHDLRPDARRRLTGPQRREPVGPGRGARAAGDRRRECLVEPGRLGLAVATGARRRLGRSRRCGRPGRPDRRGRDGVQRPGRHVSRADRGGALGGAALATRRCQR